MASGRALTDEDRAPWLERVAAAAACELQRCGSERHAEQAVQRCRTQAEAAAAPSTRRVVVACSALKVKYRTVLRERICSGFGSGPLDIRFVLLAVGAAELRGALHAHVSLCSSAESLSCAGRLEARARAKTHWMSPALLDSQLTTLEIADDLLVVHALVGVEDTARQVVSALPVG